VSCLRQISISLYLGCLLFFQSQITLAYNYNETTENSFQKIPAAEKYSYDALLLSSKKLKDIPVNLTLTKFNSSKIPPLQRTLSFPLSGTVHNTTSYSQGPDLHVWLNLVRPGSAGSYGSDIVAGGARRALPAKKFRHSADYNAKQVAYGKYKTRQVAQGNEPLGIRAWAGDGYTAGMARHKLNIRRSMSGQEMHHFATNKHSFYAPRFKRIVRRYGLDLDGDWNKMLLPHRGRHPHSYHDRVFEGMDAANKAARGDVDSFLQMFNRNVIDPVVADPTLLYR
jgi:hypothetical protein